jgi:thiosulfate/3-mercaptopyruvate sulfurtransferase
MPLVSVDELAALLAERGAPADEPPVPVVVCDVRSYLGDHPRGRREYAEAHIPGARFIDLDHDLADLSVSGAGRHPLPSVEAFTDLLGRLGITPGTRVVAYDSAGGATASRLWWMLRSIGHGRASVLDGGWQAWVAAGQPVTDAVPHVTPTQYPPVPGWTGTVTADDVAEGLRFGATVVDSRTPERYRGEVEPVDSRAGHIPGAVNVFHADNIGPDGRHLPVAELVKRFAGLGERPIVYCGSGVTACHNLLAMSLANINEARLYAGSWSEWSSDPARPAATGDEP